MPVGSVDWSSTFEGYLMFRMGEDNNTHTQAWVEASANPEYESYLLAEYDKQFK